MKAMVLNAPCQLVLEEVSCPRAEAGEVLVRLRHSAFCGTDLGIYRGVIPVKYPRIMGHEMMGEIIEGSESQSVRPGDRVIVDPVLYCGTCFHCDTGQTHLCTNGKLLGRDANGGFAEYIAVPAKNAFRLPDSVDDLAAPLIQVLTTCVHAQQLVNIIPGESVAVLGLGVTGQLHVQLAKAFGAHPVIGITRSSTKRELAEKLGADLTLPSGAEAIEKVREATHGRGVDLVIETTGAASSLPHAIALARAGGRLLLFGIFTTTQFELPLYDLYLKELVLVGARAAKSEDFPSSIGLVERGTVRLEPLISDVMPLRELNTAIGMPASDSGQRMRIILQN